MNMWGSGRRVLHELLSQPAVRSFSLTATQNTVVVERWWQVPLSKVGSPPRLHPRRHRIYKLVEDTKLAPKEKMELILTQTVPKLGGRGDTVFVKKSVGRNKLLPQSLAVYPSPENKQMFAEELRLLREGKPEERIQTRTGQLTVELLKRSKLTINKMPLDEFQLNKEVVCRQFQKKLGVVMPPHALSLPFESVKDLGDYWCEVTVNGMDVVRVPISLVPYEDPSASYQQQLKTQMLQAAVDISEPAEEGAAVNAVAVNAVAEEEEGAAVIAVAEAEVEERAAVNVVSAVEAEVEEEEGAAVKAVAVNAVAEEEEGAAVNVVSAVEAEVEEGAAVKAVAAVEAEATEEMAAVKAVSDAAVEAEAGKDSVSQVSGAAEEETAASTPTSQDTTAPPSDGSKKD